MVITMNQTYVYRKHLRKPEKFMGMLILFILVSMFASSIAMTAARGVKISGAILIVFIITLLIVLLFIGVELLIIYFAFFRRFKSISVTLTENELIYINSKKKMVIPYDDIKKLDFPSIKYTGGWMKIAYNGGNIRLTVVLENIGDMVRNLKDRLDERDMTYAYDEKKLFSFYKTAVFSDESWDRVYKNYKIMLVSAVAAFMASTAVVKISGNIKYLGHFLFLGMFSVLAAYILSEIIIGTKVKKRVDSDSLLLTDRETASEQKIFNICLLAGIVVFLVIVIVVSFIA